MSIKLTIRLSYGPRREMTVVRATGGEVCSSKRFLSIEQKPMLRIANKLLLESGFRVGNKVEVEYGNNVITISNLKHCHANAIQIPSPFAPSIGEKALVRSAE